MSDTERSVVWQYGPAEQQHIRDANRADGRPDGLTFDVEGGEVTVTGSAESIRWLYDYLHYLKRAWRNEGEQWDADTAEEMAESLYEQVDGDLPERQRDKQAMTDGGQCAGGTGPPKRRRWDENYDALPYETDEFDGGETARLRYKDLDGNECAVTVEVGEFMAHNSWLLLFDDDGSGDEHIVRADGVVLLQTWPDEEIVEVGRCNEVRSVDTGTDRSDTSMEGSE